MTPKRCPSRAELIRFLESGGSRNEFSQAFLDHVATCPECRLVVKASAEIRSGARQLLDGLEGLNLRDPGTVRRLRAQARREIGRLQSTRRRVRLPWLVVPAAGAALALVAVLILASGSHRGTTDAAERGSFVSEIRLAGPKGAVSARVLDFQWGVRDVHAETFRLEIYDQVLDPVFESAPLAQGHFDLPASVLGSLRLGAPYFWKVAGTLKNGQTIESEFAVFILKK